MNETITLILDADAAAALGKLLFERLACLAAQPASQEGEREARALQSIALQASPQAAAHAKRLSSWAKKTD